MINRMALDFKQVDIEDFLFASLPIRFQDTEPAPVKGEAFDARGARQLCRGQCGAEAQGG